MKNTEAYYSARASTERELAESCYDEKIAQIHFTLADHYQKLANGDLPLELRVVQESSAVRPTAEEIRSKAFQ